MKIALFYHSLLSDWNNGNAHFLRGYASELVARGHEVTVYEPREGWSHRNLLAEPRAIEALAAFRTTYPHLHGVTYEEGGPDLGHVLDGVDLVIVHEWTDPELVRRIGAHREREGGYALLFHDTHHRTVTDPDAIGRLALDRFDGVLAYGEALRDIYVRRGWGRRAWTWHEAADTRVFRPLPHASTKRDVVWIGNWGDDERADELRELLVRPVRELGASGTIHGVRYPADAIAEVEAAGLAFEGWLPNVEVPNVFAAHRVTVHVPRRPYVERLPGIPTIRPFEALACGIPLVSTPWDDVEGLFRPGTDYLVAHTPAQMRSQLRALLEDADLRAALVCSGLETICARHTCAHRVDALERIVRGLGAADEVQPPAAGALDVAGSRGD